MSRFRRTSATLCLLLILFSVCPVSAFCLTGDGLAGLSPVEAEGCARIYKDGYLCCRGTLYNGKIYLSSCAVYALTGCSLTSSWNKADKTAVMLSETLAISAHAGDEYLMANERYILCTDGIIRVGDELLLSLTAFQRIFNCEADYDRGNTRVNILTGGCKIIENGKAWYPKHCTDIYWLSRIISAEAWYEPMEGMIAVGNVVLNRMRSTEFPDTVHDVIYEVKNGVWQFTPAQTGAVEGIPCDRAVVAAYMCYEGYTYGENALFFVNPVLGDDSWFRQDLDFVESIGNYDFYTIKGK